MKTFDLNLPKNNFTTNSILIAVTVFILIISFFLELKITKNNFENRIHFWQMEISSSLLKNDWVTAAKFLQSTIDPSLEAAELVLGNKTIVSTKSNFSSEKCFTTWSIPIIHYQSELGQIKGCPKLTKVLLNTLISPVFIVIVLISIVLVFLSSSLALLKYKKGVLGVMDVLSKIQTKNDGSILDVNEKHYFDDDAIVKKTVNLMQTLFKEKLERQTIEERAKTARRINLLVASFAHDIKSPLSALNIASKTDMNLPGARELVELSVSRINMISDQLLKDAKGSLEEEAETSIIKDLQRLNIKNDFIEPVINAKKIELKSRPEISLMVKSSLDETVAISGDQIQLQRVLSNLINNSVDSILGSSGSIVLHLSRVGDSVEILVCDNGVGIPKHILSQVGSFGYSYCKTNTREGNGIGVYFAKKVVNECGGSLLITSEENHGTIVKLSFPIVEAQVLRPLFTTRHERQN